LIFFLVPALIFAEPILVTSDVVEIQSVKNFTTLRFLQNASIRSDDFSISGGCIDVFVSGNRNDVAHASSLSSVREIHAIDGATFEQKFRSGRADRISVYPDERIMILEGNAEISDAESGTVRGETLIFDSLNRKIKTERTKPGRSSISIDSLSKFKPPTRWQKSEESGNENHD
jgi:lipopolysaccharide export system protein LptA